MSTSTSLSTRARCVVTSSVSGNAQTVVRVACRTTSFIYSVHHGSNGISGCRNVFFLYENFLEKVQNLQPKARILENFRGKILNTHNFRCFRNFLPFYFCNPRRPVFDLSKKQWGCHRLLPWVSDRQHNTNWIGRPHPVREGWS